MSKEVRGIFNNFRPRYRGREASDNDLVEVLKRETDSENLREAWEASKEVGAQVADKLRALARARNQAARRKGFANFYQESLELSELSEAVVFGAFDDLERLTREPFRRAKAELDA
jgi:peptidyl-dipeptidase A